MPKCTIDGKEIEFSAGQNLVEVAKKGGINIPVFCYHPGLTVVAQCRMCAVEIEKMPKLQTACSTPAAEGMVVKTNSPKVKQNQKSVMEFLLVNHPLDCPICDKSGECDLQDNSYGFGESNSRYTEERRTYVDLDMGPVIQKNMNRCIHCTRCIRFGAEIAGIREMVALRRGNNTEISTIDGLPLQTEYAGNYADICPTGSLTLKDFRFKKRAWMLKKTATVCEGCSRGCNMELQHDGSQVFRCIPRENMEINRYWMCDEGRFNYRYLNDPERVIYPMQKSGPTNWGNAISGAQNILNGKKVLVLLGTDLTVEEIEATKKFVQHNLPNGEIFHFGTPGVSDSSNDADADGLLKRTSKTSNLHGMEKAGIKAFDGKTSGFSGAFVVRGGRAVLPQTNLPTVGAGVFSTEASKGFEVCLPGAAFAEKEGTVVNFQGKTQSFKRSVNVPGESKQLGEILMLLQNKRQAGVA